MSKKDFPQPPRGKLGWPWTNIPDPLPDHMQDGSSWPKISIITPSFNQGNYLEETVRSVLLQGYPNLEYILIDGGSWDKSLEIIKKYSPWITYWQSQPDKGQSHALDVGFSLSTGEIMAWINSDDYYQPGALRTIAETFNNHPEPLWVAGIVQMVDANNHVIRHLGEFKRDLELFFVWDFLNQPGIFWHRKLWENARGIDINLQHSMDYDLWFQFLHFQDFPLWVEKHLANFRKYPGSKSSVGGPHVALERQLIHDRNQDLIMTIWQRMRVKYHKNNFTAHRMLTKYIELGRGELVTTFLKALILAPWMVFQKKFYRKIKQIFFKFLNRL